MYLWKGGVQKSEFYLDFKELIFFFLFYRNEVKNSLSCKMQTDLLQPGHLPQSILHRNSGILLKLIFQPWKAIFSIFVMNMPLLDLQSKLTRQEATCPNCNHWKLSQTLLHGKKKLQSQIWIPIAF